MSNEIAGLLTDCCNDDVRAVLFVSDFHRSHYARFDSLEGDRLTLTLLSDVATGHEPSPPISCTVSFRFRSRTYVFASSVLSFVRAHPGRPPAVVLHRPTSVASSQTRLAFRVAVPASLSIEAHLRRPAATPLRAAVQDVSMSGIRLDLSSPEDAPAIGERVRVELRAGPETAALDGEVRRCDRGACGIMFSEVRSDGRLDTPDALERIYRLVERHWLLDRWTGRMRVTEES